MGHGARSRLGGDSGSLPGPAPGPALLPLGPAPLPHTLRNLCLAWGLADGAPARVDDPACSRLAGEVPPGEPAPMDDEHWQWWTWPGSGICVGHIRVADRRVRIRVDAREGLVALDLDDAPLAWSTAGPGRLAVAHVDGPKLQALIDVGRGTRREVRVQRSRVAVRDQGTPSVRWHLADHLVLRPTEEGYVADDGAISVLVDPEWTWRTERNDDRITLVGTGDPAVATRVGFELE